MKNRLDLVNELIDAIKIGNVKAVDNILDYHHLMVNCRDTNGHSLLILASIYGRASIASHLIHRGANLNDKSRVPGSNNTFTPIMWALEHDHLDVFHILVSHKASIESYALHRAAKRGSLLTVKAILQYYPKALNCLDACNQTALFWAVNNGHTDVVRYLVEEKSAILDHEVALSSPYNSVTVTIRTFIKALQHENKADMDLCNRYQDIDRILEDAGVKQVSSPSNIISLLTQLTSTIVQYSSFDAPQAKQLTTLKNWLKERIDHPVFNKEDIQKNIFLIIVRVCAPRVSFWSIFTPDIVHQETFQNLSDWALWHYPELNLVDAKPFQDKSEFLRDLKKIQSIIPIPSFNSLSDFNGGIFKSNSNDCNVDEAVSPKSITELTL